MKRLLLLILNVLLISAPAFATTYYASTGGGGAASCVDNGANVCTLARAVVVASTGTNTIQCAAGSYSISTELTLGSGNTGANLTFTCATADGCTWTTTGSTVVVDIEPTMVSGTVTFDDIIIDDGGADFSIRNQAPEVNVVFKNGSINNTDATQGIGLNFTTDTTNKISLESGEDSVVNIKTGATTNVKIAQKIVVGASNIVVNRIAFKLQKKCGNKGTTCDEFVSGESWDYRNDETLTYTIETDNAGAPSGTPVTNGTATTILAADTEYKSDQWTPASFASNVTLTASTTYWLVLTGSYTASATNYIAASTDTGDGYASGDCSLFDATNWAGCTAGTDLLFVIDRAHTRTATVQDSTFTTRSSCIVMGWSTSATVQRNSLSSTVASAVSFAANGWQQVIPPQVNSALIEDNVFDISANGALAITAGTNNVSKAYVNSIAIIGNTGTVSMFFNFPSFVKRLLVKDNDIEIAYSGQAPIFVGKEVDGTDPQEINENPFDFIVIEGNRLNYSAASHNHLIGIFMGANNGVLRDNTILAPGSGGMGIVLKADYWTVDHNNYYGISPGLYVSGTIGSKVTNNTLYCVPTTSADGCLLIRNHQDNVYGGEHGIPYTNYISDNVVVQSDPDTFAYDFGNTADLGIGRNTQQWSTYSDNNVYWSPNSTYVATIETVSNTENLTVAEGISTLQTTWQSANYSDADSLSRYNDMNSYILDPGLADPANGNFRSTNSTVKNGGTVQNTSIGSYQSSGGRKWIGQN